MGDTMRAAQIVAAGQVEVVEAPVPQPRPGYASVRPDLVSICGSDLRQVYARPAEVYPFPPGVSGHEIVGRITGINGDGAAANGMQPGDLVLALMLEAETGMAEELVTRVEDLIPLPEGVPPAQLLMAQQLGTVIFGCKSLENVLGKTVAVVGLGSVGLFFSAMVRRMGAARVIGMDLSPARVAAGLQMGATDTIDASKDDPVAVVAALTGGEMADVVIEAAGETAAINLLPHLARRRGSILCFGIPKQETLPFEFFELFRKQCRLTSAGGAGSEPGKASIRAALDLIVRGQIDVSALVSHFVPLEEVARAYELAHSRAEDALKVAVRIGGAEGG